MTTQKAIVMQGGQKASVVSDRALPKPRPGYIGVKVKCVALNPTDWKHIDYINNAGSLSGCDYSGVVESVGEGYEKQWKVGDRIAGMAHGGNNQNTEDGAFAEHIVVKADIQMRIPDSLSFEEAATLGVGVLTCGQGLFQALGLNLPSQPTSSKEPILIYGGSTATGTLGIQYAKLAGYKVLTTCSPRNFDLVKSLGAAAAFNYNDSDCVDQIKSAANDNLKVAWDTITLPASIKICAEALSKSGGKYAALGQAKDWPRDDIEPKVTMAYTAVGEPIDKLFMKVPALQDHLDFAKKFIEITDELLAKGELKVHPPKVLDGGLKGALEGLDLLRQDKVSGEKLVYRVE